MTDDFTIEYDPDWLSYQILFIAAAVLGFSYSIGREVEPLVWSFGLSVLTTAAIIIAWNWFSVRKRVMSDVGANIAETPEEDPRDE